ncbi:lipopolysaccharide transport periplasmic protein LptA [Alteromonas pelagimontana]|uniref:Lipopolysaccharide export system protein LptA n=1 Tax=Alteromonas pelagimontana TaxID=1858656 RepID=A0A6M4MDM8_9ALTE|nr:lipopolysaccharide transport periplasmic protein LptA [Alteromonas pelagimontana]QJR80246.1 lipopolysaccharide transport periplasmic protein LptA [Alteromonas pelagimontana]
MYKLFTLLTASIFASLLVATSALADVKDFGKPIKVDSKSQFIDGKNKTSVFKDNVRISQGTLVINADEVEVIASEGEGREVFIARGTPARYQQIMDDGTKVKASGNEIRYEVAKRTISLTGNAEIQQNDSVVKGDTITYDMAKEQLSATGGNESSPGRVTTVFRPDAVNSPKKSEGENQSEKPQENPESEESQK